MGFAGRWAAALFGVAVLASGVTGCSRSASSGAPDASAQPAVPGDPAAVVIKHGYIDLADGTKLAYSVALPSATGQFPVAFAYAGYCEGADPYCNDATNAHALVAAGYAVLGVNIRGTGCSTGTFDVFTLQESIDGAAAVEWAAQQEWSNGRVGMFGDSFPGITQSGVAAQHPPHLLAIAPFQITTDPYRDIGYPGGIANVGFGAFWAGFNRPFAAYNSGLQQAANAGDVGCLTALVHNLSDEPLHNLGLTALQHPYNDEFWQARAPGQYLSGIEVPVFNCQTWQDDEVSGRSASLVGQLDPARIWAVLSNGYHAQCEIIAPLITRQLIAFFDHFVKGEANGFESTPHVQVWHEATRNSAGEDVPGWITTYDSYASIHPQPLAFYFQPDGALALEPPAGEQPARSYLYPAPSLGNENGIVAGQFGILWKLGETPGASVAYTSPPLAHAAEFFGSGSADLWVSSTAPVTDLQITLSEVRPDGQELYVSRGWLRTTHRLLDAARSTALAPVHTDQEADMLSLDIGTPTFMRAQLWPFNHVFRQGSSLRLWINTPLGMTGGWSLLPTLIPALNSVYADAQHPSALVLGHVGDGGNAPALPACDTLLNQPCRSNMTAVPAGVLAIPGSGD